MSPLHVDSKEFPFRTRAKGEAYFREGRVTLERVGDEYIEATVRGSQRYEVRLIRDLDDLVDYRCTCPFYAGDFECKHIWATIVAVRSAEEEELRAREEARAKRGVAGPAAPGGHDPLREADRTTPGPHAPRPPLPGLATHGPVTGWRAFLERAERASADLRESRWPRNVTGESMLLYWLSSSRRSRCSEPRISVVELRRVKSSWSEPRAFETRGRPLSRAVGGEDLRLLELLAPYGRTSVAASTWRSTAPDSHVAVLSGAAGAQVLRELALSGRLFHDGERPEESAPLTWEETPWEFSFSFAPLGAGPPAQGERPRKPQTSFRGSFALSGEFARGEERLSLDAVRLVLPAGRIVLGDRIAPFSPLSSLRWIELLEASPPPVPESEVAECAARIIAADPRAPLVLPDGFGATVTTLAPRPRLVIRQETARYGGSKALVCHLYFDYGDGVVLEPDDPIEAVKRESDILARDLANERERVAELLAAGARRSVNDDSLERVTVAAVRLPELIERLLRSGWSIEAEGRIHRAAGKFDLRVKSGIDWLDLDGTVSFDDVPIAFPRLLGAIRRGQRLIPLDDGSFGVLPEEWLARSGVLAGLGEVEDGAVRFRPSQAWLLDALLAELPEVERDEEFARLGERIRSFAGIGPRQERPSFSGELRPYQRDGLGWLHFLRDLAIGGCLADDMGLGKTVQVIAHIEELRASGELENPVLVVAPRSVLENWLREIARFAPELIAVDASGPDRAAALPALGDAHVVLTTYAILRRDIPELRERRFDTVILDEAQAIKNSKSQTAKAARLLRTDHRLALSGTPIENHLGELWSLFEFLQPGMFGRSTRFAALTGAAGVEVHAPGGGTEEPEGRPAAADAPLGVIARAVRPFILRRTKAQVAPELPERTEQSIDCPLSPRQQELYDELLEHYRGVLLPGLRKHGVGAMAIRVIEALLRLRQAACHPGLLDPDRRGETSGKLDVLLERIEELREEGHRCLVFSQFTSFLAIVRSRLDAIGVTYEYLDGRTRDRQPRIDRFQLEGKSTAFLISLKAGGLGLNLTAADYVFLLDPWWNPASEAQAIDRAHRIGQTSHVFAYRLIAPGTVEEKIVELQESKRALADAIIRADEGLVKSLTAEDLEHLFAVR